MLTSRRVKIPQRIDEIFEEMYAQGWTDGLPVIPPTEDLVQAFVDYVGRDAQEVVAVIPPSGGMATIEKIAINAVMAGCRPEYMPVLIAAIEASVEPQFNLTGRQTTTNASTPMLIINGPIREQLGINCKSNALGQGWRANATIGRAFRLVMVNVGGGMPGTVDKATIGQPGKYTMCIGENEEESPWEPLHIERGLARDQSAVTVLAASGTFNIHSGVRGVDRMLTIISHTITAMGANNMIGSGYTSGGESLVILCPDHARMFAEAGLSKLDVKRILWERGRLPIGIFPADDVAEKAAAGGVIDGMAVLVHRPEDLVIVVAGGPGGNHDCYVPTSGATTISVTKPIAF